MKPGEKPYKVSDRDGMYVTVLKSGVILFRYDYRLNGRRETFVIGQYGPGGISLADARERLMEAWKMADVLNFIETPHRVAIHHSGQPELPLPGHSFLLIPSSVRSMPGRW